MMVKRLAILTLTLFMLSTVTVMASSAWGDFQGFQKVRVMVNDKVMDQSDFTVPGFLINNRVVLPLHALGDSLRAIVKWDGDNSTAKIYRPNVHIIVAKDITKDPNGNYTIIKPFGSVTAGDKFNFLFVFVQVDSLKVKASDFKISIVDPNGALVDSKDVPLTDFNESFWYPWPFKDIKIDTVGDYKIRVYLKLDGNSDYSLVSEKVIRSTAPKSDS